MRFIDFSPDTNILLTAFHYLCRGTPLTVESGHDVHLGRYVGEEMAVAGAEIIYI